MQLQESLGATNQILARAEALLTGGSHTAQRVKAPGAGPYATENTPARLWADISVKLNYDEQPDDAHHNDAASQHQRDQA